MAARLRPTSGWCFFLRFFLICQSCIPILVRADAASSISLVQKSAKWTMPEASSSSPQGSKNVLFIVVDDLRTNLGAYNFSYAQTPHLDGLAREGLTFKRSYVQFPFCAPSRNSFMSGRRPDATRAFNFQNHFREQGVGEGWSSLPEYFKKWGYLSFGAGKLFHDSLPRDNDNPRSWSLERPYIRHGEGEGNFKLGCAISTDSPLENGMARPSLCAVNISANEPDESRQLIDMKTRNQCIEHLRFASKAGKNFFVGCGFVKPHTPWEMPLEFYERMPADIPLALHQKATIGMPDIAWHHPADVKGFQAENYNVLCPEDLARTLRRAYYAAVAYTDYNIGKVLDELESLGFKDDTAVIVFGDHGWHLGENNLWGKYSNFELDLRIPTIIRAPWREASKGAVTNVLMEAVDIYPTLVELAGLPNPVIAGEMHLGGTSLAPVFDNPDNTAIKTAAFSQHTKPTSRFMFDIQPIPARDKLTVMGYSVRVDDWRYTAWFKFDGERPVLQDGAISAELYSHKDDDGDIDSGSESVNVIDDNMVQASQLHNLLLEHIGKYIVLPVRTP